MPTVDVRGRNRSKRFFRSLRSYLPQIRQPAAVLHGRQALPNARLVIFDDSMHCPLL